MSKKRSDLLKDKKLVYIIGICFVVIIIVSIVLFYRGKKKIEDEKNIGSLTSQYNQEQIINNKDKTVGNTIIENETDDSDTEEDKVDTSNMKKTYKNVDIVSLDDSGVEREADDFTVFLSEKINSNSIDELYNNLNVEYVEEFNYSQEKFEFENTFNGAITTEVTNVEKNKGKDRLIITTKLIESNGAFKVVDYTLFSDGTFADIPIYLSADLPFKTEIDNVKYEINKRYDTRLGAIYNIDIENNSDKLIKINDMLIKNKNVVYSYEVISDNTILESYPGIEFNFKIKSFNNSDIDYVELKCEDYEGNPYSIVILDKNS